MDRPLTPAGGAIRPYWRAAGQTSPTPITSPPAGPNVNMVTLAADKATKIPHWFTLCRGVQARGELRRRERKKIRPARCLIFALGLERHE